jgi:hypothetical protein
MGSWQSDLKIRSQLIFDNENPDRPTISFVAAKAKRYPLLPQRLHVAFVMASVIDFVSRLSSLISQEETYLRISGNSSVAQYLPEP